jgi:lysophosphatidate acyltransferase
LTLIGKQGLSQWTTARVFYFACKLILGIDVVIKNPEYLTTRPAVFLSNHQSELDILMLGATFPQYCSVTAKKSLKYYPFLGWFMAASGSVFIDRANRDNALKAFESAAEKVNREKQSVFMFPEGTRSYYQEPGLLPFKKGAFHFAVQGQIPIVPYVVSNYSKFFSFQKRVFEPGTIEIEVLPPVETKGLTGADVNSLHKKCRDDMLTVVERLGYGSQYEKKTN